MKITRDLPPTGPTVISRFEGEYRFLSNFHPVGIPYKNDMYPSVEHAYQAARFEEPTMRRTIRLQPTPGMAKKVAHGELHRHTRSDWKQVNRKVMRALTWIKYRDSYLRTALHRTGDRLLIEGNEHGDQFWGVCNGEGENVLACLIMDVRLQNRFENWVMLNGRFTADAMLFNPWTNAYATRSAQREWETFSAGFAHGHETDYRKVLL